MSRFPRLLSAGLAIAAFVGLASPATAQVTPPDFYYPGVPINQAGGSGGAGNNTCIQAATFLVRTSGLSATEINAYNSLICGMVADGTFALMDGLYVFATNNVTTAALNLVSTSFTATVTGTLTFSADHGWTGNGTTGFLNTGFNPTTATTPHFTLNSANAGAYVLTNRTAANASFASFGLAGAADVNAVSLFPLINVSPNLMSYDINDNVGGFPTTPAATAKGDWLINRVASATTTSFLNGSLLSTDTNASSALASANMFVFAEDTNGTATNFTTDQLSAMWFGGGLTQAQAIAVETRVNAYMAALGINVF